MKNKQSDGFKPRKFLKPRPDFLNPPVAEVALSVQFKRLEKLTTSYIGLLWANIYRERFPKTEELKPLDPMLEIIPGQELPKLNISLELKDKPPTHRCWFLNDQGTELVQVQQDRFAYNWRKEESNNDYPRFENVFRNFQDEYRLFSEFIENEGLGTLTPNQCDITYVNPLLINEDLEIHQNLDKLITLYKKDYSDKGDPDLLLGDPENVRMAVKYLMTDGDGKPIGRLHMSIDPVSHAKDNRKAYLLKLTARGFPLGEGPKGIYEFLNEGREWIVRGFKSLTTKKMHKQWGIKNDNK